MSFPKRIRWGWLILLILAVGVSAADTIRLATSELELLIDCRLAGRITTLRLRGGRNILHVGGAERQLMQLPKLVWDEKYFPRFHGHVMWVAPQSEWWQQQELDSRAKAAGAVWPPDPYWEFSAFSVNELAPDKVILTSSHSPFSGATMRKEVQLLPGGRVALKTVLKNTGGKSVRWGLWSNTCIPGDAVVWVQPKAGRELRLEFSSWDPAEERPLGYEMSGDFIRFPSHSAQSTGTRSFGKMFLHPETPAIVARIGDVILVKKTLPISPEKVAPGHAPVEIFGMREQDTSSSFLELEFHGEYRELAPGQSVSFLEFWEVFPLTGREIDDRFLQEILLEAAVI